MLEINLPANMTHPESARHTILTSITSALLLLPCLLWPSLNWKIHLPAFEQLSLTWPHRALLKGWSVLDWGLMRRGNSLHWMIWRVAGGEQSNINRITVFMGKHICVKICINVAMEVISSKGGYTVTLVVLLIYRLHTLSNWKPKPSSCRHSFAALQVVCL